MIGVADVTAGRRGIFVGYAIPGCAAGRRLACLCRRKELITGETPVGRTAGTAVLLILPNGLCEGDIAALQIERCFSGGAENSGAIVIELALDKRKK